VVPPPPQPERTSAAAQAVISSALRVSLAFIPDLPAKCFRFLGFSDSFLRQ
jgi:hypothetical protein